jgi:hypothetical protein
MLIILFLCNNYFSDLRHPSALSKETQVSLGVMGIFLVATLAIAIYYAKPDYKLRQERAAAAKIREFETYCSTTNIQITDFSIFVLQHNILQQKWEI